jgi:tetratricopeptide (TPR) repeat protein
VLLVVLIACAASSCAFYNTYYYARKNYAAATGGLPYEVEKPLVPGQSAGQYRKAIDYSKKLIASYPKSKWVDDAYLLWARSLIGTNDPIQTVSMLRDFSTRYPDSPLKSDAAFYLGVAYRVAHKNNDALTSLDLFLELSPKHDLSPYAHLERARVLMALKRPAEAAEAADRAAQRFKKGRMFDVSVSQRAEAELASGDYAKARADYRALGARALTDDERFNALLKEADCLEAARDYDEEVSLLRNSLSYEIPPQVADTTRGRSSGSVSLDAVQSGERWGRLTIRVGTVRALQGRKDEALAAYRDVINRFPRQALGAEAQYRIGYVYETVGDDFETARTEYGKVRGQSGSSVFAQQATQRQQNLDRLSQFRASAGDSVTKRAEGAFLLAEQYLFQLDKPDRAFGVYDSIALAVPGTPWAGKARNAQAWMLRTKYQKPDRADSLLWVVVRDYPATEAQLAARDYLEAAGHTVPDSLIKLPEAPAPPPDTASTLTSPPPTTPPLGSAPMTGADSLGIHGGGRIMMGGSPNASFGTGPTFTDSLRTPAIHDTTHTAVPAPPPSHPPAPADTTHTPAPPPSHPPAPHDTTHVPAPPDTTHR